MAIEVDLGDGKFARIMEPDELTSGDQDYVLSAMQLRADPVTNELIIMGNSSNKMRKALLCRIVLDWNLQHPLPSKRKESLDKLTLRQQKALFKAVDEHMKLIEERDDEDEDDPKETPSDS